MPKTWLGRDENGILRDFTADFDESSPPAVEVGDGAVEQAVLSQSVTLTHDQILTLPSTPVTLIPAPGAGQIVSILAAVLVPDVTAGAYTNHDTDTRIYLVLDPDGSFNSASIGVQAQNVIATTSRVTTLLSNFTVPDGSVTPTVHARTVAINKPIALGCDNPNGTPGVDLTGGNAANTLKVTVIYVVTAA